MNAQAFTRFLKVAVVSDSAGQAEGLIYARGVDVPTDAAVGYSKGCIFVQTDGSTGSTIYTNEGTVASCDFNAINGAALGSYLALAGGTMADAADIALDTTTGSKLGTAAAQKLGLWGVTPVVQPASADQAAPAAYATGAFGLDSDANAEAFYDLVVSMRTALVAAGIMKGSA